MSSLFWYPGYDLALKQIVRAENCYLYDADGHRYVDLESGVWCMGLGHGHPELLRIMADQAARIAHTGYSFSNEAVEGAALDTLSLHGFDGGRCVFLCSGSEAVEFGVRVARTVMDRPLILTMTDSYFGAYGGAHDRPAGEWFGFDWTACAGCRVEGDCPGRCERFDTVPFDEIGGFLFEPGSSSGLVRFPPEKLIRSLASRVKADRGLVLVNEVTTGVGRTGKWFGYQHYSLAPDIVAMGKGIGNGYPVSVTAVSSAVADALEGRPFHYAQSHQNDPLGATMVSGVIHIIDKGGWIEQGSRMGAALQSGMETVRARTGRIRAIRARGLMMAVELEEESDASFAANVQQTLLRRGYILARRPGLNVLRIDPSMTIERKDVEAFLTVFEDVLAGCAV